MSWVVLGGPGWSAFFFPTLLFLLWAVLLLAAIHGDTRLYITVFLYVKLADQY